jgi:hypothetical protein
MLSGAHLVQTEHLARRVVELVMVDFDVCERCVELYVDVALPGRELEGCHGEGAGGVYGCLLVREAGCGAVLRNYVSDTYTRVTGNFTRISTWRRSGTHDVNVSGSRARGRAAQASPSAPRRHMSSSQANAPGGAPRRLNAFLQR